MKFFDKPPATAGYVLETSSDGTGSAIFSKCRKYRYALTRILPERRLGDVGDFDRVIIYAGLNPHPQGGRPRPRRRPRHHPRLDGRAFVHRTREGQYRLVSLVLARRRARHVA